jgi:hypothetical protein
VGVPEARDHSLARLSAVGRLLAELALDGEKPVVLGDALGATERTGLDLAGARADGEVGD